MAFTLAAWYKNVDPDGTFVPLDAITDPHLTVSGMDILVPSLNNVVGLASFGDILMSPLARLTAPSLLEDGFSEYLLHINAGTTPNQIQKFNDYRTNPIVLSPVEAMKFEVLDNPASAVAHYGLVWLADGAITPVNGRIRQVRAVCYPTLQTGKWINASLSFPVSLKAGRYQIVGMKVLGQSMIAGRLVIPGQYWRPGVLASRSTYDAVAPAFEPGQFGVFGEFYHASPPTVDLLGVSETLVEVYLDLIYVGD